MLDKTVDKFAQELQLMYDRISQLYEQTGSIPNPAAEKLLPTAFKELGCASEELQVAADELLQQQEELLETRTTLEVERDRYSTFFEYAPDAYLRIDSMGIVQEANQAACTLLNISCDYILGKPISIFVSESERANFRYKLNHVYTSNKGQDLLTRLSPRQGEPLEVALTFFTIPNPQGKQDSLYLCIRPNSLGESRSVSHPPSTVQLQKDNLSSWFLDRSKYFYSKGDNIPLNPQSIWLVCQGVVKLTAVSEDASEVLMGLAGPEMPFGLSRVNLSSYQAIALSKKVQLVCISLTEIAASPNLAQALLPKINRRIQQTESLLAISGQRRVQERLHHLLLLLKQEIGQPVEEGIKLAERLTHNDFASACSTTRVTMTRMLGRLQQQGKITTDREGYIILKPEKF